MTSNSSLVTSISLLAVLVCGCGTASLPTSISNDPSQHKKTDGIGSNEVYDINDFPRMARSADFAHYERVHWSAKHVLPWAVQLEEHFGDADHFITHFGFKSEKLNTWNSVVHFGERYELTLQVQVRIDYAAEHLALAGSPEFFLIDITEVMPDGTSLVGKNIRFGESEFAELVASNWDFTKVGLIVDSTPVKRFDLAVAMERAPRYPISLLKRDRK